MRLGNEMTVLRLGDGVGLRAVASRRRGARRAAARTARRSPPRGSGSRSRSGRDPLTPTRRRCGGAAHDCGLAAGVRLKAAMALIDFHHGTDVGPARPSVLGACRRTTAVALRAESRSGPRTTTERAVLVPTASPRVERDPSGERLQSSSTGRYGRRGRVRPRRAHAGGHRSSCVRATNPARSEMGSASRTGLDTPPPSGEWGCRRGGSNGRGCTQVDLSRWDGRCSRSGRPPPPRRSTVRRKEGGETGD